MCKERDFIAYANGYKKNEFRETFRHDNTANFISHRRLYEKRNSKLSLRKDALFYSATTPKRVPLLVLPKVEEELNRLENEEIVEKFTEPTYWNMCRFEDESRREKGP